MLMDSVEFMAKLKVSCAEWWPAETACCICGQHANSFYKGHTYCTLHLAVGMSISHLPNDLLGESTITHVNGREPHPD